MPDACLTVIDSDRYKKKKRETIIFVLYIQEVKGKFTYDTTGCTKSICIEFFL